MDDNRNDFDEINTTRTRSDRRERKKRRKAMPS